MVLGWRLRLAELAERGRVRRAAGSSDAPASSINRHCHRSRSACSTLFVAHGPAHRRLVQKTWCSSLFVVIARVCLSTTYNCLFTDSQNPPRSCPSAALYTAQHGTVYALAQPRTHKENQSSHASPPRHSFRLLPTPPTLKSTRPTDSALVTRH